jgi:hypothetical protein
LAAKEILSSKCHFYFDFSKVLIFSNMPVDGCVALKCSEKYFYKTMLYTDNGELFTERQLLLGNDVE